MRGLNDCQFLDAHILRAIALEKQEAVFADPGMSLKRRSV
jgi:hypothetical protein